MNGSDLNTWNHGLLLDFLKEVQTLQPGARRVLLTAYADSNAAIDAINSVKLNHYLMKPWEPPEQNLFPVLSDLLEDWHASYVPDFDGLFVVGSRWAPDTHRIKDFFLKLFGGKEFEPWPSVPLAPKAK